MIIALMVFAQKNMRKSIKRITVSSKGNEDCGEVGLCQFPALMYLLYVMRA